ncbi:hypothetical protein [Microtetraspora malaysiensis]|uniref:hypothetical protein n=1 Tax=Microtetraspora malaysiensis TaxID=161358 RepID=UPI00082E5B92|nr:hypothetical protein [Microtetraspora malaysiensis]
MESTQIAALSVAVVLFVVYRQMMTRRTERRGLFVFAGVMMLVGLAGGGVVDIRHPALGVLMLIVELAVAVGFGFLRAATVRVWRDEAGVTWSRGTCWTAAAWLASLASRVALLGAGYALGLSPAPTSVLLFVGLTIAVQSVVVTLRARTLPRVPARPASSPLTS